MPRAATTPMTTGNIGVGFGLLAGLVGIGQWVLMAFDYAARVAAFQAWASQAPPGTYLDGTDVYGRGNDEYFLITALIAAAVMLVLCLLAAFTAGLVAPQRDDGLFAAWAAAGIAALTYTVATGVAFFSIPFAIAEVCCCPIGVSFGCLILALSPGMAEWGQDIGAARLRRRGTR